MRKWFLIPTRAQWSQWSLPSKLTFAGTLVGLLGLLFGLFVFLWPQRVLLPPPIVIQQAETGDSPSALTSDRAREEIDAMIRDFPGRLPVRIFSITSPVQGVSAVAIEPPYREFPNVILFRYDEGARRWKRVLEGLCLGIQPEVSNILDLHTIGFAADVSRHSDAEIQRAFAAIGAGHGMVAVQYKHFIHFHESGRETYFIDKREFPSFAKALMAETMSSYPDDSCILFDMPKIADLSLSHDFGRFRLVGETLNGQRWTVTFIGIDGGGYLDQKHISVKSIATVD